MAPWPGNGVASVRVGELVEVWSDSQQAWIPACVSKVDGGYATVGYVLGVGIHAEKIIPVGHEHMRPAPRRQAAEDGTAAGDAAAGYPADGHVVSAPRGAEPPSHSHRSARMRRLSTSSQDDNASGCNDAAVDAAARGSAVPPSPLGTAWCVPGAAAEVWSEGMQSWAACVVDSVSGTLATVAYTRNGVDVRKTIPLGHESLRQASPAASEERFRAQVDAAAGGTAVPSPPGTEWCVPGAAAEVWSELHQCWAVGVVDSVRGSLATVRFPRDGEEFQRTLQLGHPDLRQATDEERFRAQVDAAAGGTAVPSPPGTEWCVPGAAAEVWSEGMQSWAEGVVDYVGLGLVCGQGAVAGPGLWWTFARVSGTRDGVDFQETLQLGHEFLRQALPSNNQERDAAAGGTAVPSPPGTQWCVPHAAAEVWNERTQSWAVGVVDSVGLGLVGTGLWGMLVTASFTTDGVEFQRTLQLGNPDLRQPLPATDEERVPAVVDAAAGGNAVRNTVPSPLGTGWCVPGAAAEVWSEGMQSWAAGVVESVSGTLATVAYTRDGVEVRKTIQLGHEFLRQASPATSEDQASPTASEDQRLGRATNELPSNSPTADECVTAAPSDGNVGRRRFATEATNDIKRSGTLGNMFRRQQAFTLDAGCDASLLEAAGCADETPGTNGTETCQTAAAGAGAEAILKCSLGHALKSKKGAGTIFSRLHACQDCSVELPAGTWRLSCKPCYFDLCDDCRRQRQDALKDLVASGMAGDYWEIGARYFSQSVLSVRKSKATESEVVMELAGWRWVLVREVDMVIEPSEDPTLRTFVARVSLEVTIDSGVFCDNVVGWVRCKTLTGKVADKVGGGLLAGLGGKVAGMVTGAADIVIAPAKNILAAQLEEALTGSDDSRLSSLVDAALDSGWGTESGPIRRGAARIAAKELQQAARGDDPDPRKLKGALVMAARLGATDTDEYRAAVDRYREVRRLPEGWEAIVEKRGGCIRSGRSEITDDSLVFLFQLLFDTTHRDVWTRDRGRKEKVPTRLEVLQVVEVQNDETWFNYVVRLEEITNELERRQAETGQEITMWSHRVETGQGLCARTPEESQQLDAYEDVPTFELEVPAGALPGSMLEVPCAPKSGLPVRVRVPAGATEGQMLVVAEPMSASIPGPSLSHSANEVLLFHGTSSVAASCIADGNFRINLAGSNAGILYGRGIYLAENASKSDEYCTADEEDVRTMLLCRTALGNVHYTDEVDPDPRDCEAKCLKEEYNAVLGDRRKTRGTFREYVVFDPDQVYPNFLIKYRRVF